MQNFNLHYRDLDVSLDQLKWGHYISAISGCCALKFLHALQTDQPLLAHIRTGRGSPQKKINPENLKFSLKFSMWAPVTSELVGASSQNFYQTTCRDGGD